MSQIRIKIEECNKIGGELFNQEEFSTDYYMSEMTQLMRDWLWQKGFFIESDELVVETDNLDEIERIAEAIVAEYDCEDEKERIHWDQFGLSSDDDVDYNGSYIEGVVEIVRVWLDPVAGMLEKWRQEVCFGDDVECTVTDAVRLMVSHLNEHKFLKHPELVGITEISELTGIVQEDMLYQVERAMIRAGLEKIYQIEKGR